MRRCLHSLLVGVLTFSLSFDAARACGHMRRWRHCPPPCAAPAVVVCVPCAVVVPACTAPAWACGCDGQAPEVIGLGGWEEIAWSSHAECCGSSAVASDVTVEPLVGDNAPAAGSVVVAPEPTPATPAAEPVPAAPGPAPIAVVPDLEPVEPVSATEPELEMPAKEESAVDAAPSADAPALEPEVMDEEEPAEAAKPAESEADASVPATEEPVTPEPAPAVEPQPEPEPAPQNVFEEADTATDSEPQPLDETPLDAPPTDAAPFDAGVDPGADPNPEPAAADAIPFDEPPMEEEPAAAEPAIEPDPAPAAEPDEEPAAESGAAAEPLRRWIDDTASYAVVGRLVDVRGDQVEILRADGRDVRVPLARLSGFDRDYVAAALPRLAAARRSVPAPTDTVSR